MSDERQAFEQLHAIPSGVEWCEKRHIYIHKNYSGLVLHPINESWKAFCEGALWQASRDEGEPIGEVGYMIQPNWDDPSKTKGVALVDKSLAPGTKLYTHPASRQALSSCSEIPNSSDPDSRQALEGEAVAEITEGHVLQWRPPYNRPPVGTKLYAQPPTKADEQAHKRVHEYDGAHKCLDCGAQWGALPGHPKEPEHCAALAQPVSVPDGRSNEWLKTLDRWIDLMDRLEGEPINTSVQREIYRVKTEVMRYRKHKVAPKQEQDDE